MLLLIDERLGLATGASASQIDWAVQALDGSKSIAISMDKLSDQIHLDTLSNSSHTLLQRMVIDARKIQQAIEDNPSKKVLICQPSNDAERVKESVLHMGACLILSHRMHLQQVVQMFQEFSHEPVSKQEPDQRVTLNDCWGALQHVRDIGWMSWKDVDDDEQPFLVDEFMHYADAANGSVHIVAPGQLLLFSDPVDLSGQQLWVSVVGDDEACTRRFSPAFYADLFADLGVAAVACLTESGSSGAAFAARGIEPRDLCPGGSASPLRALDGLLSLSRAAAPGAVAVHGGGGAGWAADAGVVVAAWLVGRAGFAEGAAYAWLHMLCPGLLRRAVPAHAS